MNCALSFKGGHMSPANGSDLCMGRSRARGEGRRAKQKLASSHQEFLVRLHVEIVAARLFPRGGQPIHGPGPPGYCVELPGQEAPQQGPGRVLRFRDRISASCRAPRRPAGKFRKVEAMLDAGQDDELDVAGLQSSPGAGSPPRASPNPARRPE